MEHLVNLLPELTLLIVEKLVEDNNNNNINYNNKNNDTTTQQQQQQQQQVITTDIKNNNDNIIINESVYNFCEERKIVADALSFARTCKGVEVFVEYVFRKKCVSLINPSFRGWKDINNNNVPLRWTNLYLEALKMKKATLLAWSFHEYTPDECQKVFDHSKNRNHGIRTFTEITDGQFGKAMRLPHPIDGSLHQMKGSQVHGMVTPVDSPVDQFTFATWLYIHKSDTSSLISLLLTPKVVPNQKTMMMLGQSFIVLNISATGNLFFGRNNVSTHSLQPGVWHHIVVTGNAKGLRVYAWDATRERTDYAEILCVAQACVPSAQKLVVMIGNGKKGEYSVEELCLLGWKLDVDRFWWLRDGLPFI